nr:bulb-type lectin domain-containing protein [Tanacetum cinerariifolium]
MFEEANEEMTTEEIQNAYLEKYFQEFITSTTNKGRDSADTNLIKQAVEIPLKSSKGKRLDNDERNSECIIWAGLDIDSDQDTYLGNKDTRQLTVNSFEGFIRLNYKKKLDEVSLGFRFSGLYGLRKQRGFNDVRAGQQSGFRGYKLRLGTDNEHQPGKGRLELHLIKTSEEDSITVYNIRLEESVIEPAHNTKHEHPKKNMLRMQEEGTYKVSGTTCIIRRMFKEANEEMKTEEVLEIQNAYLEKYFQEFITSTTNKGRDSADTNLIKQAVEIPLKSSKGKRLDNDEWNLKYIIWAGFIRFMKLVNNNKVVLKHREIFRECFESMLKWFYNTYIEGEVTKLMPPMIGGYEICLFDLYKLVKCFGGYERLNYKKKLDEVSLGFGFSGLADNSDRKQRGFNDVRAGQQSGFRGYKLRLGTDNEHQPGKGRLELHLIKTSEEDSITVYNIRG